MKICKIRFAAVLIAVILTTLFSSTTVYAWDNDMYSQTVYLGEVPEGTAFADILVKDGKNDRYAVSINEENLALLGIGSGCGLASYSEDGFTSLLLRHSCAVVERAELSSGSYVSFRFNVPANELFRHYDRIKAAYCDKNGDVLGVTDEVRIRHVFGGRPAYDIKADGKVLTCNISTGPPYYLLALIPFGLVLLAAAVILHFILKAIRKKQTEKMIKRIQSGESDNGRKE